MTPDKPGTSPVTVTLAEPGESVELKAMSYIASVLKTLDPAAQTRVLTYLLSAVPIE